VAWIPLPPRVSPGLEHLNTRSDAVKPRPNLRSKRINEKDSSFPPLCSLLTLCFKTTTLPTTYCLDYCLLPRKRSRHVTFHRSPLSHIIVPARTLTIPELI